VNVCDSAILIFLLCIS